MIRSQPVKFEQISGLLGGLKRVSGVKIEKNESAWVYLDGFGFQILSPLVPKPARISQIQSHILHMNIAELLTQVVTE
jgi:hypothetical protein